MNKSTRRAVLYSLFGLFLILGAAAILYAQGYRLNLGTFAVQKVGAIYIRTYPKTATVKVDGKETDRGAMLLNSGTLIQDLFPKTHDLTVDAPGYASWTRKVSIKPTLVTEVQAILLPEKSDLVREKAPLKFWALPDAPLIEFLPGLSYSGQKIPGSFVDLSPDRSQVLTRDASKNYYLTNLSLTTTTIKSQKLANIAGGKVFFDQTPGQFISYNGTGAAILSVGAAPSPIFTAPKGQTIIGADASKNLLAFVTLDNQNRSWLWLYEKLSGGIKKIDFVPGKTVDLKFSPSEQVGLLEDTGNLYLYDPSSGGIATSSARVKSFSFSDDGSSLAVLSEKTLDIYSDNGRSSTSLSGVKEMYWYADNSHLFLQFSDHLGLLDLLDLQPEDIQFINGSTENSYDSISNSLYFVKDSGLYRITFPS